MSTLEIGKRAENKDVDMVKLAELSELAGVPMEYIKEELLLDGEEVSMEALRSSMLNLLDQTFAANK
ncbi:hypothetical protein [Bacteriovorax sp. Seq25_V]|uniref:hypothetical protein n=1 Tax=Bacteriovorax sp. Seq25_V TaxID=1201288 RepID=UPI00038A5344|nr:hypothetical protein [Bacteriovorax sp. Seq25_V]EQC45579.1 hypothetical protein M900_2078 [Bacteriovorax sp. Seq25_V]